MVLPSFAPEETEEPLPAASHAESQWRTSG